MITKEMIDRINFLSRKSKAEGLTEEEKSEQQVLRRKYVDAIKYQVRKQLENIKFVDDEGNTCGCGHEHKHGNECGCGHSQDKSTEHEHGSNCGCKKH
ncbi:MAG: DUF896 domain-containing protein [Bacillota bacterium]